MSFFPVDLLRNPIFIFLVTRNTQPLELHTSSSFNSHARLNHNKLFIGFWNLIFLLLPPLPSLIIMENYELLCESNGPIICKNKVIKDELLSIFTFKLDAWFSFGRNVTSTLNLSLVGPKMNINWVYRAQHMLKIKLWKYSYHFSCEFSLSILLLFHLSNLRL